jgi:hypothetical protein
MGYLFQEVLRPHPLVAELLGNQAISSARIVVAQDEAGPTVAATALKIVTGNDQAGRFCCGSTGNLVGHIDRETGRLSRVVEGFGPRAKVHSQSPDTGRPFTDFVMPDWPQVVALCLRAATALPLLRIQHWDVAITNRGPVILGLRDVAPIGFLQINGAGLLTDKIRRLLCESAPAMPMFAWLRDA